MWDNPRLLNLVAGMLIGLALLAFLIAGAQRLLRSQVFPLHEIVVTQPPARTTRAEIEAAVRERVTGNFFALDLGQIRAGLETLPWVRRATVRRVWPDRLEVSLEEHVALARWGGAGEAGALVDAFGERFVARTDQTLPLFVGPAGTEREVASRYARFSRLVAPLGAPIERLVLTPRFAWQLRLAGGLTLMLGRDADLAESRLRRFVAVYDQTLKNIPQRHEYVDLRYPNGFAVRVPDLATRGG